MIIFEVNLSKFCGSSAIPTFVWHLEWCKISVCLFLPNEFVRKTIAIKQLKNNSFFFSVSQPVKAIDHNSKKITRKKSEKLFVKKKHFKTILKEFISGIKHNLSYNFYP